jgi:hypothetical protein
MPNPTDNLWTRVVELANAIPQRYSDPLKQAHYEKGYLIAVLNSLYTECYDVRTLVKHKITTMKDPHPENSRDAW